MGRRGLRSRRGCASLLGTASPVFLKRQCDRTLGEGPAAGVARHVGLDAQWLPHACEDPAAAAAAAGRPLARGEPIQHAAAAAAAR